MGRDEKSKLKKLTFEQYICASFCFFFFSSVHTRVQSAKCRKKKGRAWQWASFLRQEYFRQRWNNRWKNEGEARKRVDLRKDERAEDGGDEKCGGYTLASYLEYELWLLNFIVVREMNRVSRHTFTSNSLQVGGRKKLNKSFLRRVSFSQSSFFSRIFCRRINATVEQFAFLILGRRNVTTTDQPFSENEF